MRIPVRDPQAGAAEKGVPLYKHIADLAGNSKLVRICSSGLPMLFASSLSNGLNPATKLE